jgi:hypothetical protein
VFVKERLCRGAPILYLGDPNAFRKIAVNLNGLSSTHHSSIIASIVKAKQ